MSIWGQLGHVSITRNREVSLTQRSSKYNVMFLILGTSIGVCTMELFLFKLDGRNRGVPLYIIAIVFKHYMQEWYCPINGRNLN